MVLAGGDLNPRRKLASAWYPPRVSRHLGDGSTRRVSANTRRPRAASVSQARSALGPCLGNPPPTNKLPPGSQMPIARLTLPALARILAAIALTSSTLALTGCRNTDFPTACAEDYTRCDDYDGGEDTSAGETAVDSSADTHSDAETSDSALGDASDMGDADSCVPIACPATACGKISNGCGATIDCPGCASDKTCDAASHTCLCKPITACPAGLECGTVTDGCGGTFACPICTGGKTCNDTTNKCETTCSPATTCPPGRCGTTDNGCGTGTLSCPGCTSPQSCGGGGTAGFCGCKPSGACGTRVCGTVPDGCGGSITCGSLGGACAGGASCDPGGACIACAVADTRCSPSSSKVVQTCAADRSKFVDSDTCPIACAGGSCVTVTKLSAAGAAFFATTSDGNVYAWGKNDNAQLALGDHANRTTPVRVAALVGFTQIAGGERFACGVNSAKNVYCWGSGTYLSTIGDGHSDILTPTLLPGISSVAKMVGSQAEHICALTSVGQVYCWGPDYGAIGTGTADGSVKGVTRVMPYTHATDVAIGQGHSCALEDGLPMCWGDNSLYQLGDGTKTPHYSPSRATFDSGTALVSQGNQTCLIIGGTSARCWGENDGACLGDGTRVDRPGGALPVLPAFDKIWMTDFFGCARKKTTAEILCWSKQAGLTSSTSDSPTIAPELAGAQDLTTILLESVACFTTSRSAFCWGSSSVAMGDGTLSAHSTPSEVLWP